MCCAVINFLNKQWFSNRGHFSLISLTTGFESSKDLKQSLEDVNHVDRIAKWRDKMKTRVSLSHIIIITLWKTHVRKKFLKMITLHKLSGYISVKNSTFYSTEVNRKLKILKIKTLTYEFWNSRKYCNFPHIHSFYIKIGVLPSFIFESLSPDSFDLLQLKMEAHEAFNSPALPTSPHTPLQRKTKEPSSPSVQIPPSPMMKKLGKCQKWKCFCHKKLDLRIFCS